MKTVKFCYQVPDYEHSGDLEWATHEIKSLCPDARILRTYEEEDYEAESDYEEEYGEDYESEPIYQGYVEFEVPITSKDKILKNLDGCWEI